MNQKELKELIEFMIEKDIAEFELERGDVKVKIKRPPNRRPRRCRTRAISRFSHAPVCGSGFLLPRPAELIWPRTLVRLNLLSRKKDLHIVRSPIVGTFYESPSPGSPPFVKVGDAVEVGQVLCIVEAMKLMNEIECDVAGELVKKLVANGQPIEYGQELFAVRPTK